MVFFRINDVDIRKACKSPKMRLLSKLLVTLQPQWAPFVENMQSTQLKVKKQPFSVLAPQEPGSVLLRSQLAPQEQGRCSSGALAPEEPGSVLLRSPLRVGAPQEPGSVLLRSTLGSELLRSQGRCSSGAGARGGSCQERPSPTTRLKGVKVTAQARGGGEAAQTDEGAQQAGGVQQLQSTTPAKWQTVLQAAVAAGAQHGYMGGDIPEWEVPHLPCS